MRRTQLGTRRPVIGAAIEADLIADRRESMSPGANGRTPAIASYKVAQNDH
ncbi:hypothetical protein D3C83_101000 [compost metagenome]